MYCNVDVFLYLFFINYSLTVLCQLPLVHTHTHTQPFYSSLDLSGTIWVSWYQKVHFAIFWIFWCKMKITQADCHPIQTDWCPHLCHPHHFYAGCASWHNPPNLSLVGTSTKYAGLHTQWLGTVASSALVSICLHILSRF